MFSDLAVIIPARMGSSRIKNKVLLEFNGTNLLEWKIKQLLEVIPAKNIFLSTENEKLKKIASKHKIQLHHRDPYLSQAHEASFSEVICGIVKDISYSHIAWVVPVVPLMHPKEYLSAFEIYFKVCVEKKQYDSLFSANLLKEYFWSDKKPLNYQADKNHTISQNLPNIFRVTNGLYMRSKEMILKEKYFLGKNPYKFCVSKISGVDIDDYEDYEIAKALLFLYDRNN